jgi:hypothetical protein
MIGQGVFCCLHTCGCQPPASICFERLVVLLEPVEGAFAFAIVKPGDEFLWCRGVYIPM